ncbi:MAG: hypothetical protein KGZ39_01240 [Simkania sp.]|nr:hypothetical protein [Simkania sp.]
MEENGFNYLPGITNLIFAPYEGYKVVRRIGAAAKVRDHESLKDQSVRCSQLFFAFSGAVGATMSYSEALFKRTSSYYLPAIACGTSVVALMVCFLEGIMESIGLARQIVFYRSPLMRFSRFLIKNQDIFEQKPYQFIKELQKELTLLATEKLSEREHHKTRELISKALRMECPGLTNFYAKELHLLSSTILAKTFAKKYFDYIDVSKVVNLERRVGIRLCNELDKKLNKLAQKTLSMEPQKARQSGKKISQIFQQLNEQAIKKMLVYIVGIFAVIITAATIILGLGSGVGIPVIAGLLIAGLSISIARHCILHGTYYQNGWAFHFKDCLPSWLIDKVDHQRQKNLYQTQ